MNSLDKLHVLNELLENGQISRFLEESIVLEDMVSVSSESIESIRKLIENTEKSKQLIAARLSSLRKSRLYICEAYIDRV